MNEEQAKQALNERLRGMRCQTPVETMAILNIIWQAACEWRDSQVGEPYAYIYEFNSNVFGVHRSFSSNQWNGMQPTRVVKVYTTPPAARINQQLVEALEAAVACGMVPSMSARSGGACAHVEQLKVADQIRDALAAAKETK